MAHRPHVVVVGAGLGGVAAAVELLRAGTCDVTILERADDVGGVWRDNTYPGAACDVPAPFYSYSFAPNPHWPRRFARQPAILAYVRDVVERFGLRRHLRLGAEVTAAAWDEGTGTWLVTLAPGEQLRADHLVMAVGQLSRPVVPSLPGREDFAGAAFHSAAWDHDVELAGRAVVVVGTGASAVQLVPAIAPEVGSLTVVQRSAPHVLPRPDTAFGPLRRGLFRRVPATLRLERSLWYHLTQLLSVAWTRSRAVSAVLRAAARLHARWQTRSEPGLFEQVWPDDPIGCKRLLFSSDWFPALRAEHVELTTSAAVGLTRDAVVTEDGTAHHAEVVVWATGFAASALLAPIAVRGRGGADLHDCWADGAHAYYGMAVPDFPNLHVLYGPNTNTGGGSVLWFLEIQARWVRDAVAAALAVGAPLEVRAEVEEAHDRRMQSLLVDSVWTRCGSWYRDASGRVVTNWPLLPRDYRREARFDLRDFTAVAVDEEARASTR